MGLAALAVAYAVLNTTVFGPVDTHGANVEHITFHSKALGAEQTIGVVVPPGATGHNRLPLLVFLHGRARRSAPTLKTRPSSKPWQASGRVRRSSLSPKAKRTATGTTGTRATGAAS